MTNEFAEQQISLATLRWRELQRMFLRRYYSGKLPIYIVTEFPKSGGTWFAKMLAETLGVPFPPAFSAPRFQPQVMRGHYGFNPSYQNTTVVVRDGRDVMVSAYHHLLFPNEANVHRAVEKRRRNLGFSDFDDVTANMPKFIAYMFEEHPRQGYTGRFSWAGFVNQWKGKGVAWVKYEDLLSDGVGELRRVAGLLAGSQPDVEVVRQTVARYSFKAMTGRDPGSSARGTFARKGIAGDWHNVFNQEARTTFDKYAGKELISLGYEPDDRWVKQG